MSTKDIALFFDIDGTLCDPSTTKIPHSAIEEISNWRNKGYRCCIATGRCRSDALRRDAGNYEWDGIISANGQEVYGPNNTVIERNIMDKELVQKTLQLAKEHDQTLYLVTDEGWDRIGPINENVRIADKLFGGPIPDEKEYVGQDVIYMIAFGDTQDSYGMYEELGLRAATSYYHYADLVLPNFDKAKGIQKYLEHENIHAYYAFGDSGNDLEMLQHANKAIVMGNGDEGMFKYADEIAPRVDEDGLSIILKKLRKELGE